MTLTQIAHDQLPPASVFLDTVCPGQPFLDLNVHFSLKDEISENTLNSISGLNWPLTGPTATSAAVKAHLELEYLNVARPPFQHDIHKNIESTTYVSLPFHMTNLFSKVVSDDKGNSKQDGEMHVGANVNPLMHDPFRSVHLNPGCVTSMLVLSNSERHNTAAENPRNPFNKMTTSINRLLRGNVEEPSYFVSLLESIDSPNHINHPQAEKKKQRVFNSLLNYDPKTYHTKVKSPLTSKLLVSANINVVNVFGIDDNYEYIGEEETTSTTAVYPIAEPADAPKASTKPYKKVIEVPLLRFQLHHSLMVTSILTLLISGEPMVVLGLNSGKILCLNLATLTYRIFDNFETSHDDRDASWANVAVTSLSTVAHPNYELLLVVGFMNGEVAILDPFGEPPKIPYTKAVVGKDNFITFFKKLDLSPFHKKEPLDYLIGHFKLSHKPITLITSTIPYQHHIGHFHNPMILAIASEDGLVRFLDLINTHGANYGDSSNFYNTLIVTDVVLNYFQDGVRSIEFSPDFRFFCMCGKGDLIEIFKMTYYNVNGLLLKNQPKGRSRSGTVNSGSSGNFHGGYLSTPNTSFDFPRAEQDTEHYPPMIKDISIVSRLKGHTNTVENVSFVRHDELSKGGLEDDHSLSYKLISGGSDGRVIIWDFDSKALPLVRKSHIITKRKRQSMVDPSLIGGRKGPTPIAVQTPSINHIAPITTKHSRTRSWTHQEELAHSFSNLGINKLLSPSPQPLMQLENTNEQQQIVISLYRSLFEVRLKRHYALLMQDKEKKRKYTSIIHGIINDKELPSIQIPLLEIDLSCLLKDGKIQAFHVNPHNFWVFGRNGDIFKYTLDG